MIELAKVSTTISAPVAAVFDYVTNMENYGEWFPGVVAIKSGNNLPHARVGKTYLETLQLPGGEHELSIDVVQSEALSLFLTQGDLEGILPQMTMRFSEEQEGVCTFDLQYHSRNSSLSEESEIITALRKDLVERAAVALVNLKNKF
ncbi:SRPBCC family protein [Litoribrevibacter euphylliae]|uniref:SRPBCC family protein n=1 Tax=Litoribrevibacter euphylliae TaxID=1834034 RepID=A0ABV7HH79_9GAMM